MKPPWQQQQQQMRRQQQQMQRQQEQMRRRQMEGAYWQQQQKDKARKAQADVQGREDQFAQVEGEVARLRQALVAGRLTEEQVKAQLHELMVQDEHGNWWMVGYETGEWYRHEGTDWVRADPPGRNAPKPAPSSDRTVAKPAPSSGHMLLEPTPLPAAPQTSGMAIGSLLASTLGLFLLPVIGGIIGIILGNMARNRIRASGGTKTGMGLATAGIVLGWIQITIVALGICLLLYAPLDLSF